MQVADMLIEEVYFTARLGQQLLETSGLGLNGVVYVFVADDTLVINCKDRATVQRFEEGLPEIHRAIDHFRFAIQTIWIELDGRRLYHW